MKKEETNSYKTINVKLKFEKSKDSNAFMSFIHKDKNKGLIGVRKDNPREKQICLVDFGLEDQIVPKVLYQCRIIPMKHKNGYIVVEAKPVEFEAEVVTSYLKKHVYQVEVIFGNKTILYDPKDGIRKSERSIADCIDILEKRYDIKNKSAVVEEFIEKAVGIIKLYEKDGFKVKSKKKSKAA